MSQRIQLDYGQTLRISTPDTALVGYTLIEILVTKPTGEKAIWTPTTVDTVNRVIDYVYAVGDLNRAGTYNISVRVTYGGTSRVETSACTLTVGQTNS